MKIEDLGPIAVIPVRADEGAAYDIRYGHWSYWTAHNNPHAESWSWQGRAPDNAILLVFKSKEERDSALELAKRIAAREAL